jgi:CheY-like chemotaxis protein
MEQAVVLTKPRWQTQAAAGGRTIRIKTEPGPIPTIFGDAAELREALTNLIVNAVDAMPEGGVITLGTQLQGDKVALHIRDSGSGMSEEVRRRCLEPFFTTKGKRGTGLGLSMVFGIIQRHGGTIDLQTALGVGTTFTFEFPAYLSDATGPIQSVELSTVDRLLKILVVDDQPVLCELLAECLSTDGHHVTTAEDPRKALDLFRTGSFDLVITDHAMEGLTGAELATEIKKLAPSIPVLLLTGYRDLGSEGDINCGGADVVLGKPISHIELRRAIAAVLASA